MSTIEIESTVTKMKIGKTEKDEREESSGLTTQLAFSVVGSPRSLARMANLLKQGNVNITLVIKATNAATDVKVESIELPHQMGLGEIPIPPVPPPAPATDMTANAGQPPIQEKTEPGVTAIRTGEPIVAGAETEAPHNGKDHSHDLIQETAPVTSFIDLSTFDQRPANGTAVPHAFYLLGQKVENNDLKRGLLDLFARFDLVCATPEELAAAISQYPECDAKSIILEVLNTPLTADEEFAAMPSGSSGQPPAAPPAEKFRRRRKSKSTSAPEETITENTDEPDPEEALV